MPRLETRYNIPSTAFPEIVAKIREHLTPKSNGKISRVAQYELGKVRAKLTDKLEPFSFLTLNNISWDFAAQYAKDIGLFQLANRDEVEELNRERYAVPSALGSSRCYTVEIFGKNVNCLGGHPMVVRMDGESAGHESVLYLLESWYESFKKDGAGGMRKKIKDTQTGLNGAFPEYDGVLEGLPKTAEEFESRIKIAKKRLALRMVAWSINAVRFYWDFFGSPIQEASYSPLRMTVGGPSNFEYQLSNIDLEKIIEFPTLPQEQVLKQIFPELPKDLAQC